MAIQENVNKIVGKVKTKDLQNLDTKIIKDTLDKILKKEPKLKNIVFGNELAEKSGKFKTIVKLIKQELHRCYGSFQDNINKRENLLKKLKQNPKDDKIVKKILLTHKSTKERIDIYDKIYEELFSITKTPKTILDIGCGLKPLTIPNKINVIASEFNKEDNKFIEEFFKIKKRKIKTVDLNLEKDYEKLKRIKADVVLAWKLFDLVPSERIIKNLNAKYLIASFSTMTLGKKQMNNPRRSGFQKMLRRLNLEYETKEYKNEIFYIIKL